MCESLVAQHLSTTTNNTHTQADIISYQPVSKRHGNPTATATAAGRSSSVALSLVASQSDARTSSTTTLHHTTHLAWRHGAPTSATKVILSPNPMGASLRTSGNIHVNCHAELTTTTQHNTVSHH